MNKNTHFLLAILLTFSFSCLANTKKTVTNIAEAIILTDDVDLTVTAATPFTDEGVVDIVNTDHAVLILNAVKPSAAFKLLKHVKINGADAKNGTNCQVKLYNRGCIILPYTDKGMLTVYSEPNFGGTSVNNFGTEHSGGYMNTLTEAKLNNKIRSFRLKRGYMVTFSTLPSGRGYSRCFIAADKDLEVAELPTVLDQRISSYRVFKWFDTGKPQVADAAGNTACCSALNVTSSYTWGVGQDMSPDFECVPNHIHEGWPAIADCGKVTYSPHMKTNNEPRNPSDDSPATLSEILANWEQLMATGMRLCSPSSWDGSDYWDGSGFLKEFFDSIDARGWRCDIIDLHGYWAEGSFSTNIPNWYNAVKRPVWVSEWCWGASWNKNGAFASGVTQAQVKSALQRICPVMNSQAYVERYYYWNSEADISKIYKGGALTPAGEYYSTINSGVGYNGKYDFIPTTPRQYDPQQFDIAIDGGKATISWYDPNGEYNQLMEVQRKLKGGQWTAIYTPEQKEKAAKYSFVDEEMADGANYRVHIIDVNGIHRYTDADLEAGDQVVTPEGQTYYAGGNLFANGDFNLGLTGWTSGTGNPLSQPQFEAVTAGGIDGDCYLQAYQSTAIGTAGSLKTVVAIEPQTDYLFRVGTCNGNANEKLSLSSDGKTESKVVAALSPSTEWQRQEFIFNSGDYSQAIVAFRNLGTAQIDKVELRRLFTNYDDAIADGEERDRINAQVAEEYETEHPDFDLSVRMAEELEALLAMGVSIGGDVTYEPASVQPQSPSFSSATGWTTAAGTYKGGDQRLNTVRGKTCWNAWWANLSAATGTKNTMEIKQEVTGLPQGIYTLQCKATTQHHCLSDQHGYMVVGNDTVTTTNLKADYMDLPAVGNIWETLTTLPAYVPEGGSVTIGFTGSKKGATDNAWHEYGNYSRTDKREGWWCATDFQLLYHPLFKTATTVNDWHTICLPYKFLIPDGLKLYEVAGILLDQGLIAVREVTETEAGCPYIYTASQSGLSLYEYGDAAKSTTPKNGLRGYFKTSSATKAPVDSYVLTDNKWQRVTGTRPAIESYTAIIRKIDDLEKLTSWDGLTIPVVGLTDGIKAIGTDGNGPVRQYRLDGTSTEHPRNVYIEVRQGQTRKKMAR